MNEVVLSACHPTPLASYLKALGIFRLVAEQLNPEVRGFWRDDMFVLSNGPSSEELEEFLLKDYSPSPIMAPWGARSGFYPDASEKAARQALNSIEKDNSRRLALFRDGIEHVRNLLVSLGYSTKPKDKEKLR